MSNNSLGNAYVQIVPVATGITKKMDNALAPGATSAGVTAGKTISASIGATLQKVGGTMMKTGAIMTAASVPIIAGVKKALDAYQVQSAAETKLTEIYKTRMGVTQKAAQATADYAKELQKTGVVGDEVMLSGAQQLATFAKTPDTVNKLLPAMNNLMVQQKGLNGTQQDATNIANLMGKVLGGQVGALKRVGITFDENQEKILKTGNEEERAAMLAQVITDNVGNMNKAMLKTPEGKIQQMKNAMGDLAEQIGGAVAPVLADIAQFVSKNIIPTLDKFFKMISGNKALGAVVVAITAVLAVGGPLMVILGMIVSSVGALLPVVTAISAPILAIVGAIAAVIAILGVAYAKNEAFRTAVNNLIKEIGKALKSLVQAIMPIIKSVIKIIAQLISEIAGQLAPLIQKITPLVTKAVGLITTAVKVAGPIIVGVLKTVATVVSGVVGTAIRLFTGLVTKVTAVVTGIKNAFNKISSVILTPIKKAFEGIKSLFKLPHITVNGGKAPWGIAGKGVKPSFDVKWYAKGGVFNNPSIIGVGEAGREAVLPLQGRQMRPFAEAIASELNGHGGATYNIGDIKLSMDDLKDIVTLEQFVEVVKRAKAFA